MLRAYNLTVFFFLTQNKPVRKFRNFWTCPQIPEFSNTMQPKQKTRTHTNTRIICNRCHVRNVPVLWYLLDEKSRYHKTGSACKKTIFCVSKNSGNFGHDHINVPVRKKNIHISHVCTIYRQVLWKMLLRMADKERPVFLWKMLLRMRRIKKGGQ